MEGGVTMSEYYHLMQEGSFSETILWDARDKLEPPAKGFVMFASSCPETNVPFLMNEWGIDEYDIIIVLYDGHETIWYRKGDDEE